MAARSALSLQYDNRARVSDHPAILARWAADSQQVRARQTYEADLRYGSSAAESLDFFPARRGDGTTMVFLHGGYWRALDKHDCSFLAPPWSDAGVSLVVPNYGLCPAVSMQEIVRQALRASAWIFRNAVGLGINRNRLYVVGHSAGGQLAAMLLAALWPRYSDGLPARLFQGGASLSGLHDLRPLRSVDFLISDLKLTPESALRLSPAYLPPATDAPLIACVGGDESAEYQRQTRLLQTRWRTARRFRVDLPGINHFTIVDALADPASALFRTIGRMMGLRGPAAASKD